MSFEDEYTGRSRQKSSINKWLPAFGFLLLIALAAISFVLSEPVHELLYVQLFEQSEIENFTPPEESFDQEIVQYGVGVVLFFALVLVVGLLYAAFAPKKQKTISERDLKKERQQMEREAKARQIQKQKMNKQYASC